MSKKEFVFLFLIILAGVIVRLYKFDAPIADWHSWRQADTSSVSREFVKNGIDFLHPTYQDISNVPSGMDNPKGYRFVEFPIYNSLQAGSFLLFKTFTVEQWGRIITIFASLCSSLFLFLIVRRHINAVAALASTFFFTFLPFNVYYGRTILPDPSMVAASLAGIYFFNVWIDMFGSRKSYIFYVLSIVCAALAFLIKPYALFFTLPMIVLSYQKFRFSLLLKWQLWLFAIVSAAPLIWWRTWITQFPEGVPNSLWLFNQGNIRFTGAYFYWLFADRIGRLILGYWGIGILVCGFIGRITMKSYAFFLSFAVSSLLYMVVIAKGNVQHDYYQILIIPSLSIFLGLGVWFLIQKSPHMFRWASLSILGICLVFSLLFGWYFVRDYYNINNPAILEAGKAVDSFTSADAKVIALYNGDTTFLYQTNRKGWASLQDPIPDLIKKGAEYLVIANPTQDDLNGFGKQYQIVSQSSDYLLLKLE